MTDWPQAGGNAARTGFTPDALGTNVAVTWRHDFGGGALHERVHPRVQVVMGSGTVIVPTLPGRVYAFNATADAKPAGWGTAYTAVGAPVSMTPALDATHAHVADFSGNVTAIRLSDGFAARNLAALTGRLGPMTAPPCLTTGGQLVLVDHWGQVTSLDPANYSINWQTPTIGADDVPVPIRMAAAHNGTYLIVGAMDMRVRAYNSSGTLVWTSPKLFGGGFPDFWPVCTAGQILLRPMPNAGGTDGPRPWKYTLPTGRGVDAWDWADSAEQTIVLTDVDANPQRYAPVLYRLSATDGTLLPHVIHPGFLNVEFGPTAPPAVTSDPTKVVITVRRSTSLTVAAGGDEGWGYMGGYGLLDINPASGTYRRIIAGFADVSGDATLAVKGANGYGNRDENTQASVAANKVVSKHVTGYGQANYEGIYNMTTQLWTTMTEHDNGGPHLHGNFESGLGNPPTLANGWIYHLAANTVAARHTI